MATFQTQVEALTGISIDGSSNPTQTELSLFLVDGVKDVIHRMIIVKPTELVRFTSTTNNTSSIAKVGKILTVAREHDSTTILRKCTKINPGDRYEATNIDSLKYRSKYNPGFYELNGSIYTVPEAGSGNNDIVVTQIFYDTGVAFGDEVPDNFPESYAYLVALYAGIKSLENAMSAKSIPTISGDSAATPIELTDVSSLDSDNTIDELTSQDDIDQWWSTTGHLIEGEEDAELASIQIQKISAYVQAYQAQLQGNNTDYTWMQGRHQILSQQYERAFALMAPPQQQQQQPQRRTRR